MTPLRWWAFSVAGIELVLAAAFLYCTFAITQAVNRKLAKNEQIGYFSALLRNVPLMQLYERLYPAGKLASMDRLVVSLLLAVVLLSTLARIFAHI
jgi:hypothetical protein